MQHFPGRADEHRKKPVGIASHEAEIWTRDSQIHMSAKHTTMMFTQIKSISFIYQLCVMQVLYLFM